VVVRVVSAAQIFWLVSDGKGHPAFLRLFTALRARAL